MGCTPLSINLEVNPTQLQKIIFGLTRSCPPDNTVDWKLNFQLQERTDPTEAYLMLVSLQVEIDVALHPQAAATAKHGLDESQRGQAQIAAQTASDFKAGNATLQDAQADAQSVIAARAMSTGA